MCFSPWCPDLTVMSFGDAQFWSKHISFQKYGKTTDVQVSKVYARYE